MPKLADLHLSHPNGCQPLLFPFQSFAHTCKVVTSKLGGAMTSIVILIISTLMEPEVGSEGRDNPLFFFTFPPPFIRDGECTLYPVESIKGSGEGSLATITCGLSWIIKPTPEDRVTLIEKIGRLFIKRLMGGLSWDKEILVA